MLCLSLYRSLVHTVQVREFQLPVIENQLMQYNSSFLRDLCICVRAVHAGVYMSASFMCICLFNRSLFVPKHLDSARNYVSVIVNIQIGTVQILLFAVAVFNYFEEKIKLCRSFSFIYRRELKDTHANAMCKFNQNLFLITICGFAIIKTFSASPVDFSFLDDLMDGPSYEIDPNHDLRYDQRQNGTENLRLNVDGVVIAFPASTSNQATSAATNLAANYLLQLAAASDEDDDSDYLPFLKNANNENAVSASNDKETIAAHALKDDKNSKKKSSPPGSPKEPAKVVVLKETIVKHADEVAEAAIPQQTVEQQQQAKIDVIPVKKVQSRRKK